MKSKRGRAKQKASDNSEENSSFSHKLKKNPSRKKIEPKAKPLNKRAKSRFDIDSSSDEFSNSMEDEAANKYVKVPVEPFNSNKVFAEVLNKANKEPQFLMLIKNLLSGCSQTLQDKRNQINKKWNQLRNSNCTQDQYRAREQELKRMEVQQIRQIKEDIISRLTFANIKGFETRMSLITEYKEQHPLEEEDKEYIIDDNVWDKYHGEQMSVLEMLMKESDFVSKNHEVPMTLATKSSQQPAQTISKEEDKQMENKFNTLEENSQATEFLFCKHFTSINYDKIFDIPNPFKLSDDEKYYIDSQAMAWLLESKCDEIYTNDKFQKQTFSNYSQLLKSIYHNPHLFTEGEIIHHILEVSAYILNSVHYYQKFKLKCELLHPLDVLLVIEKLVRGQPSKEELRERIKSIGMDIEGIGEY